MRQFIEINDRGDTSETRIDALVEQFALEPFNLYGSLDDDDVLIVETTDLGIVVCTVAMVVADASLSDEMVTVTLGGQDTPLHRRCLVSNEVATPAVVRFLRYRDTPVELGWIPVVKMREWGKACAPDLLTDEIIIEMWLKGNRVDAVREFRRSHSLGLKEALEMLQSMTEGQG
jgi:hypothetical protein